jgi:UDP:flavonoid glycosyltransferase YjiC (YdhE family)
VRLLFFPSDIGGGFGHISRCLALAYEAVGRGHTCAFVLNTCKFEKQIKKHFLTFISPNPSSIRAILNKTMSHFYNQKPPLFTEISGLAYQVIRDGFSNEDYVRNKISQYFNIVNIFRPDVLIGDLNLLACMLSKKADVPLIQIIRYAFHPKTANLVWWKNKPEGMISPDPIAIFNPLRLEMGLNPISKAEDLLRGDMYIVPSIPEIEPIPEDPKTIYVGELTVSNKDTETPSWFNELNNKLPFVYVTVGGGAGPVGNKLLFSTVVEAFADKPVQVVVSASTKFNLEDLPRSTENIRFFNWVPGKFLISKADLVVFHGGYGTMMEIVTCGKPAITIPFQTEQEGNGRRLEQLGSGCVINLSIEEPKRIENKWKYGKYSFFVQQSYDLTAEILYREIEKTLNDKKYKKKAEELQSKIKNYHGAKTAMEAIEKRWS